MHRVDRLGGPTHYFVEVNLVDGPISIIPDRNTSVVQIQVRACQVHGQISTALRSIQVKSEIRWEVLYHIRLGAAWVRVSHCSIRSSKSAAPAIKLNWEWVKAYEKLLFFRPILGGIWVWLIIS